MYVEAGRKYSGVYLHDSTWVLVRQFSASDYLQCSLFLLQNNPNFFLIFFFPFTSSMRRWEGKPNQAQCAGRKREYRVDTRVNMPDRH
jgi:hypothetical protein